MADFRGAEAVSRKADSCLSEDAAPFPFEPNLTHSFPRRATPLTCRPRSWRLVLLATVSIIFGGTVPTFAVTVTPLLSPGRAPSHANTETTAWVFTLPGIVTIVATIATIVGALATIAGWRSSRQSRQDRRSKQLEALRIDATEQARLISEAEYLIAALTTKVKEIHAEINAMADIRDRASIDPSRPLRLEPTAFALHRHLFNDYKSYAGRLHDDLRDLKLKLTRCQEVMRPIVSAQWSISPTYAGKQLFLIDKSHKRLTTDAGIVLNEASKIVTAMLGSMLTLQDQLAGGGSGTGATRSLSRGLPQMLYVTKLVVSSR
jgi:hypothetical protein